jgi:threonine synthase
MKHDRPTSLVKLHYLAQRLRLPDIYAKCEIENPTGTHKHRIAASLVLAAVESCARGITVGSCGNLGVALAQASLVSDLTCIVFVPRSFRGTRSDEMRALGAEVITSGECYEAAVEASRQLARDRQLFDANPFGHGGELAIRGYGAIVDELVAQCPITLGSIWLPVGNGTCAAGVHARLKQQELAVRIGVVGSTGNTALTASLAAGRLIELDAASLKETEVNEPLVNWCSLHAREAMEAVHNSNGYFCDATDADLIAASDDLLRSAAVRTAPAGAAGLVGLEVFSAQLEPTIAHVVILTA